MKVKDYYLINDQNEIKFESQDYNEVLRWMAIYPECGLYWSWANETYKNKLS